MSKAMDALAYFGNLPECDYEGKGSAAYALLRDYITTTEAKRIGAREVVEKIRDHEAAGDKEHDEGYSFSKGMAEAIVLSVLLAQSDESAARIKELEEAQDNAQKSMDAFAKGFRDDSVAAQWARGVADDLRKALSGARKVEP